MMIGRVLVLALAATSPIFGNAWAEDPPANGGSDWTFAAIPYLWASAISLDADITGISAGEIHASTDVRFSDILSDLDFALLGRFEAANGPYGLYTDFLYLRLTSDTRTDSFTVGPVSLAPINIDTDLETLIVELGGSYRLWQGSVDTAPEPRKAEIAAVAGVRYAGMKIDTSVSTTISGPLGLVHEDVSSALDTSKGIWDPIIGADMMLPVDTDWSFRVRGDVGPFGVGSDLTWSVAGLVSYQAWENTSLQFGYRALYYEFDESDPSTSTEIDMLMHGPLLAITFTW